MTSQTRPLSGATSVLPALAALLMAALMSAPASALRHRKLLARLGGRVLARRRQRRRGSRRSPAALAATLAVLAAASSAPAQASIDPLGNPHGHDRKELHRRFHAMHPRGFRIVGYFASPSLNFRYAGVYYLKRRGGVNVASGVVTFRRAGRRWLPARHPSRRVRAALEPSVFLYTASLSGSGSYLLAEATDVAEPDQTATTRTEIQLTLLGRFGAGREKLLVDAHAQEPEPDAPRQLVSGTGTSSHTDAFEPVDDYSCTLTVGASTGQTSLSIGWHGRTLEATLDLGQPQVRGSEEECGADIHDPGGEELDVEVHASLPNAPLGKPFGVPIALHHHRAGPITRAESGEYEETLSLDGTLRFELAGLEPPSAL